MLRGGGLLFARAAPSVLGAWRRGAVVWGGAMNERFGGWGLLCCLFGAWLAGACGSTPAPRDHKSRLLERLSEGDEGEALPPEAPEVSASEAFAGSEPEAADLPGASEPGAERVPRNGPARVTVKVILGEEELPIRLEVVRVPSGERVFEVRSGTMVRLEPGTYALRAHVEDASLLADTPRKQGDPFTVSAGEERTEELTFGRARVQLRVFRGSRRIRKGKIELRRAGSDEVLLTLPISDRYVAISPGRYDATVHFGREKVDVSGLTFQGGAEQIVPIRVR